MKNLKRFTSLYRLRGRKRLALLLLAVLFVIGQLVFDGWAMGALQDYRMRGDSDRLVMMLTDAIHDVTKPAVVEPTTQKVYLPDADIVLPPYPKSIMEVRYAFDGQETLQVTTGDAVQSGNAKLLSTTPSKNPAEIFSQVPNAQACAKGLYVKLHPATEKTDDSMLAFTKTLHDGRQMDVHEQNSCAGYDFTSLIDYLRQAESYKP